MNLTLVLIISYPASPYKEDHHWRDFREPHSEDDAPEPGNGRRTPWTKSEEQILVILSTALLTPDGTPDWSLIGSKLGRTQSTCKSRLFAIMKMRGEPTVTVTRKREPIELQLLQYDTEAYMDCNFKVYSRGRRTGPVKRRPGFVLRGGSFRGSPGQKSRRRSEEEGLPQPVRFVGGHA